MLRIQGFFISKTLPYSFCTCVRNIVTFVIEKMKLVSFRLFLDFSATYRYKHLQHMWRAFWVVGGGGGGEKASKNKLKDTSFIFPMTSVFRTHAQKEYGKGVGVESARFHGIVNSESLWNAFCCLLCIFYCRTTAILKSLGQFENLVFVIMSTRENIRLIASMLWLWSPGVAEMPGLTTSWEEWWPHRGSWMSVHVLLIF